MVIPPNVWEIPPSKNLPSLLSLPYTASPSTDLYAACERGDLETVRSELLAMPEAINEFIHEGKNLLMW